MFMDVHEVMNGVGLHGRRFLICIRLDLSHAPLRLVGRWMAWGRWLKTQCFRLFDDMIIKWKKKTKSNSPVKMMRCDFNRR